MKNNISLLCLALLAMLGLGSCDENETPLYNTERTALNIWFGLEDGSAVDSLTYNYSYSMDEDSITFYARVSGLIADHDRTFSLEVVDGDIKAQADQVCKNVGEILKAAGTGFENVVKTTCFLADIKYFADFNEVYAQFFPGKGAPARSAVGIAALPKGAKVEIEAIAIK